MNPYRLIMIAVGVFLIGWAFKVYANTVQMTTYYPAPTGHYDKLTVAKGLKIPCHKNIPPPGLQQGWIWYQDSSCDP